MYFGKFLNTLMFDKKFGIPAIQEAKMTLRIQTGEPSGNFLSIEKQDFDRGRLAPSAVEFMDCGLQTPHFHLLMRIREGIQNEGRYFLKGRNGFCPGGHVG